MHLEFAALRTPPVCPQAGQPLPFWRAVVGEPEVQFGLPLCLLLLLAHPCLGGLTGGTRTVLTTHPSSSS